MTTREFRPARLPAAMRPLATEAIRLARDAGRILRRRFRTGTAVTLKGPADVVTAADIEVQGLIVRRLRRRFPSHGILAEEGLDATAGTEWRWIVDPLDGTKNFARGIPSFCVSIAVERAGRVELGVVHDPVHGELFVAVRGCGAWRNGRPIRVSEVGDLAGALLGTGLPHRVQRFAGSVGRTFTRFAACSLGVRDRGAGALDLCHVACGRFDGYWEIDQSPWDIAAGGLIVTEAGGRMSDFRGGPSTSSRGRRWRATGRSTTRCSPSWPCPAGSPDDTGLPCAAGRGVSHQETRASRRPGTREIRQLGTLDCHVARLPDCHP